MSDLVWQNTVDGRTWDVRVERTGDYTGTLVVTRISNDEVILREDVSLSYGAIFGPDVADVAEWADKALDAIDSQDVA